MLAEQTLPCSCTETCPSIITEALQSESVKTDQLSAMLPAKCTNTGHMVVIALIKQNWQTVEAGHLKPVTLIVLVKDRQSAPLQKMEIKWLRWFGEVTTTDRSS